MEVSIKQVGSSAAWSYGIQAGKVVNDAGQPVQLRGVNWFGFETNTHVVHGLWARNWKDMITQMQAQGFNAVRLPFASPATLHGSAPPKHRLRPQCRSAGPLGHQVMDKVVNELSARGMYVLLDHHTPDCQTISGLWYTPATASSNGSAT